MPAGKAQWLTDWRGDVSPDLSLICQPNISSEDIKPHIYHWLAGAATTSKLFLSGQSDTTKDSTKSRQKTSFAATNFCRAKHIHWRELYHWRELPHKYHFCRDKIEYACSDKTSVSSVAMYLSCVLRVCHTRQNFCRDKKWYLLARVCRHKKVFCRDKTFVATKMILVATPANDWQYKLWQLPPVIHIIHYLAATRIGNALNVMLAGLRLLGRRVEVLFACHTDVGHQCRAIEALIKDMPLLGLYLYLNTKIW